MKKNKSISINQDVMEQIKTLAKQENISVSQYIENILLQEIKNQEGRKQHCTQ